MEALTIQESRGSLQVRGPEDTHIAIAMQAESRRQDDALTKPASAPQRGKPRRLTSDDLFADDDDDDRTDRPVELRRYIRSLSQRSLDFFEVLDSKDFLYQQLELPKPKEKPPPEPTISEAAVLFEALHSGSTASLSTASTTSMRRSASAGKLAFHKPFDTKMVHAFSRVPRFEEQGSRPMDILVGPGDYSGPAVDPRRRPKAAKVVGKWTTPKIEDMNVNETRALGPGTYNPPMPGMARPIGVYDESMPSFLGSTSGSTDTLKLKPNNETPGVGQYEPKIMAGIDKQPGRRGAFFGAALSNAESDSKGAFSNSGSTPEIIGPGAYNPRRPADKHTYKAFLAGRPSEHQLASVGVGPGSHQVAGTGHAFASHPSVATTVAAKLGPIHSFAGKPYSEPSREPEERKAALALSKSYSELNMFELTAEGRMQRMEERNEGFKVRDLRIAAAAKVRETVVKQRESMRRAIEHKQEVRAEIRAQRAASMHRQLSLAVFVAIAARAELMGMWIEEMREYRAKERRRIEAANKLATWWLRSMYFAKRRQQRAEVLARGNIRACLRRYLERAREQKMNNAATILLHFLESAKEAGFLPRAVKESMYRIRFIQRAWRRVRMRRATYVELAVMQWNWFEPRRIARLEKRRKQAAASAGGGGVMFSAKDLEKHNRGSGDLGGLYSRRGSAMSDAGDDFMNTPRGSHTPRRRDSSLRRSSSISSALGEQGFGGMMTPRLNTPRLNTPRLNTPRMSIGGGLNTPRLNTPRAPGEVSAPTTPRLLSAPQTPRLGGSFTPRLHTPRDNRPKRKKTEMKLTRVHPMKNQIQGNLVLPDSIKRLKMMMLVRQLEREHRRKWKKYRADVRDVQEQLRKQVETKETVAAAKQLLLGLDETKSVSEAAIQEKLRKAVGPPPTRTPWLPEKELHTLIDEALKTYQREQKKLLSSMADEESKSRRASTLEAPSDEAKKPGALSRGASRRGSIVGGMQGETKGPDGTPFKFAAGITADLVRRNSVMGADPAAAAAAAAAAHAAGRPPIPGGPLERRNSISSMMPPPPQLGSRQGSRRGSLTVDAVDHLAAGTPSASIPPMLARRNSMKSTVSLDGLSEGSESPDKTNSMARSSLACSRRSSVVSVSSNATGHPGATRRGSVVSACGESP